MKSRQIGTTGIQINGPLALGGNVFGWTIDESASFKILDAYLAAGMNFIDTADVYSRWKPGNSGGESEAIIGKWMKQTGNRAKVVIATKVGIEMGPGEKGLGKAYIFRAVEKSLRTLGTDYIDLYQSHRDDPETPIEQTLEAYDQLIKQGKVRAIGASNYSAERLAEALSISSTRGLPRYQCLQPHYNLIERSEYERSLESLCVKENIGVIPYFSLASGFLTGKYRSEADLADKARGGRVKDYLNERGYRILAALDTVASQTQSNPAQVALAWLIARPGITAPIASATKIEQLHDLVASTQLALSAGQIEALNTASN